MRVTIALTVAAVLATTAEAQQQKPTKLSNAEAKRVAVLIGQLDSKKFPERERAMKELAGFGKRALAEMEKAVEGGVGAEAARRLGQLIDELRAPEREAKRIAGLIKQLTSPLFRDREGAMNQLRAAGRPAVEQLRVAARSADLEVARRADMLVRQILKQMK
jgi:hypothetical protein